MAIRDGYVRWSDDAVGAIRWDTEEKEGLAVVIDEANGEVYEIGGGGNSDFTTVNGSFTIPTLNYLTFFAATHADNSSLPMISLYSETEEETAIVTFPIILYKGSAIIIPEPDSTSVDSISGNIVDNEDGTYTVTGDFSVTCSTGRG